MLRSGQKTQRRQTFPTRYKIAELLYERGVTTQDRIQAIEDLENCVGIFVDLKVPKKWEESKYDDLQCSKLSPQELDIIQKLRFRVFDQLSSLYLQIGNTSACNKICDYMLLIEPRSTKALLKRAKARIFVDGVSEIDYKLAEKDLQQAQQFDNHDQEIKQEYGRVQNKLKEFQSSKQGQGEQKQKKQIVFSDSESSDYEDEFMDTINLNNFCLSSESETFGYELSYEQDPSKPIPIEVNELGKFIETRGQEILKIYEQSGRRKEAEELQDKLKKALAAKKQLEKISQLDFNRPKKVLVLTQTLQKKLQIIAQNFGIDLHDPQVQNEFKKIQQQNIEDIRIWLKQNQWNYEQNVGLATKEKKKNKQQGRVINIFAKQHKNKFNRQFEQNPIKPIPQQVPLIEEKQNTEEELNISCGGCLNNIFLVLSILVFISTLYYQLF
ncbi:hypothetical protein pb186bvf_012128 [Paramecium bursaria]